MIQSMTKAGIWTRPFVSVCTKNMEFKVGQSCSSWEMLYLFLQGLHIRWVEFWTTLQDTGFFQKVIPMAPSWICEQNLALGNPSTFISSPFLLFWLPCIHLQCLLCHPHGSTDLLFAFCCCWPEIHIPDKGTAHSQVQWKLVCRRELQGQPGSRQLNGPAEQAWHRCGWAAPRGKVAAIDTVQVLAKLCHLA